MYLVCIPSSNWVADEHTTGHEKREDSGTDRSYNFLNCIFFFFSSALVDVAVKVDGPACAFGASSVVAAVDAADFLARFAGGGWASSWSSSYRSVNQFPQRMERGKVTSMILAFIASTT